MQVFDHDKVGTDDYIGQCELELLDILKSPKYETTSGLRLYDKAGKPVDKDATNPVLTISVSAALLLIFSAETAAL